MTEETTYVRQSTAERQQEILLAALEKAQANGGVLLNSTEKSFPRFLNKNLRINPVNALMMAMHSDQNEGKTNVYTMFNDTKTRGESVRKGQKGVPFTWTNTNEYVSKDNPDDKISRKEYQLLDDKEKESYKVNPREETNILFNIDQTTMHHVHKEDYDKQVKENGTLQDRGAERDDKALRIDVNQFILNVRENLVNIRKDGNVVANYDAQKDIIHLPPQNAYESYADYVQETARQIAHATAIPGRLNRDGAVFEGQKTPSEDKQQREILVEELSSAYKMLELGMPAKLRPETVQQLPQIMEQQKANPAITEKILHDVNRTVGMIKKAENGEKINLIEKPSEQRQQKWAEQFPIDKVPETFSHIVMTKDDEGKWTLVAKPENERTFAVRPTYQDVSMYFDMIKNDHDEAKTEQFRTQFAQKYYAELAKDPSKEVNMFKSEASEQALSLITKANAFKGQDDKVYLIATIGEDRQKPVALTQSQWSRMFLADDKRDYKLHLAANLYADVIQEHLDKQNQQSSSESLSVSSDTSLDNQEPKEQAEEQKTTDKQKSSETKLSPLLRQFYDLKKKHPDALLLFRTGDFYETYCADAEKASKILGVTLTKSSKTKDKEGKPLAMAGFPYHALDAYLPKLIRAGQRVAICDQIEEQKSKLPQRGITEQVQSQEQEQNEKQEEKQTVEKEESHARGFHR